MIGLPSLSQLDHQAAARIWLAAAPADMRCGFDRLAELAASVSGDDPLSGRGSGGWDGRGAGGQSFVLVVIKVLNRL